MAGTKEGGEASARTNKARYGEDFHSRIGRKGGQNGHTGGFYANRELARTAGAKGGRKSKRKARRWTGDDFVAIESKEEFLKRLEY